MVIWLIRSFFRWTEQCVQLQFFYFPINMQVQQWAGLWTQLTAPWLEGRGDGSRWPETAKWPVCDPEHIDWHGCTALPRLIILERGTDWPGWHPASWSSAVNCTSSTVIHLLIPRLRNDSFFSLFEWFIQRITTFYPHVQFSVAS